MKIKKIEELSEISSEVVRVIQDHIEKTGDTTTGFAHKVGVHPLQLLGFLRRERGMHIDTIERIGIRVKESRAK
jgi:hypothetical protein